MMDTSPWRALLPKNLDVCGVSYEIRSDYRAVLDICTVLSDPELNDQDKAIASLDILYPAFAGSTIEGKGKPETVLMPPEHYHEAIKQCFWFINCGMTASGKRRPKLVDWEKDFKYIVAPVNRVCGKEIRSVEYMHWWTFIATYQEIGDCTFAQMIRIRERLAKGKALDKTDREWYRQNRDIVDLKAVYTAQENKTLSKWMGK